MLKSISITRPMYSSTESFDFDIATARSNPFLLLDIQGLGPVPASLGFDPYGSVDGEQFSSAHVGKRNIVIKFGLNPNHENSEGAETLRQISYQYFMPKSEINIKLQTTEVGYCTISGVVETCEPNIFSKNPELIVSILCPQPHFKGLTEKVLTGITKTSGTHTTIPYLGTVEAGFTLKVSFATVGSTLSDDMAVRIYPKAGSAYQKSFTISNLNETIVDASNYAWLNTNNLEKDFSKKQTSPTVKSFSLFKYISSTSKWPKLTQGGCSIFVYSSTPVQNWELRWYDMFGGL